MLSNRSVPADSVLPHLFYPDVVEAIAWLSKTFGLSEHYRHGDPVSGAQMRLGNAWIMLKKSRPNSATPAQLGYGTQSLTVFVEEVDEQFHRVKSSGAHIVEDLNETVYGERQFAVEDFAGHLWLFSKHSRDLSPEQWGASVLHPVTMTPQISPMLAVADGNAALEFYKAAFDATILWHLESSKHVVAGLSVYGAQFFLAQESPEYGTRGPESAGFTTVRIELFVSNPAAVHSRALAAGARERNPVVEHRYHTIGPRPIKRMLQGALLDPFGHMWLVGKILE